MKLLQNKSTGEIGCLICSFGKTPEKITIVQYIDGKRGSKVWYYNSLAELTEEWEDYEEPKEYWCIDTYIYELNWMTEGENPDRDNFNREIGNYFETKEEAEKAVEKLKAFKRLKDKGFRFNGITKTSLDMDCIQFEIGNDFYKEQSTINSALNKDLDICFGGEE